MASVSAQERLQKVTGHVTDSSKVYLFSQDTGVLTPEQRDQYERDGFIVVRGMVSETECQTYLNRFEEICNMSAADVRKLNFLVMRDVSIAKSEFVPGEHAITKLQDWQDDPTLFQFPKTPSILEYVKSFCGPNVKSIHTMLINKPPDTGAGTSRHPVHQDLHYFPMRPADRIVCAWMALEHIHRENGCLTVIPGSHRQYPLLQHDYPEWEGGVNKMYHGVKISPENLEKRVFLEMNKGDVVFFHPLLIHGSGKNRTKGFRKAISCHYASSNCYTIDITGTTQEPLAQEAAETFKKRAERQYKIKADSVTKEQIVKLYTQSWRAKARLVSGEQGTF